MQGSNHSPYFGRNLHHISGETFIMFRAKPSFTFGRNLIGRVKQSHFHYHVMFDMLSFWRFVNLNYAYYLHKVIPITFIRLCLLPSQGYAHHLYITYSLRYSSHLNPFLGMKSLKSVVQNIIRLLHHCAISFCHLGMT